MNCYSGLTQTTTTYGFPTLHSPNQTNNNLVPPHADGQEGLTILDYPPIEGLKPQCHIQRMLVELMDKLDERNNPLKNYYSNEGDFIVLLCKYDYELYQTRCKQPDNTIDLPNIIDLLELLSLHNKTTKSEYFIKLVRRLIDESATMNYHVTKLNLLAEYKNLLDEEFLALRVKELLKKCKECTEHLSIVVSLLIIFPDLRLETILLGSPTGNRYIPKAAKNIRNLFKLPENRIRLLTEAGKACDYMLNIHLDVALWLLHTEPSLMRAFFIKFNSTRRTLLDHRKIFQTAEKAKIHPGIMEFFSETEQALIQKMSGLNLRVLAEEDLLRDFANYPKQIFDLLREPTLEQSFTSIPMPCLSLSFNENHIPETIVIPQDNSSSGQILQRYPKIIFMLARANVEELVKVFERSPVEFFCLSESHPEIVCELLDAYEDFMLELFKKVPNIIFDLLNGMESIIIRLVDKYPRVVARSLVYKYPELIDESSVKKSPIADIVITKSLMEYMRDYLKILLAIRPKPSNTKDHIALYKILCGLITNIVR